MTVVGTDLAASEEGPDTGTVTFSRTGPTTDALTVLYGVGGTAVNGTDYNSGSPLSGEIEIPIGQASAAITITPVDDEDVEGNQTVVITLISDAAYNVGSPSSQTVVIADNDDPVAAGDHPRTILTSAKRTQLRSDITANTNGIRDRWQAAVNDFEAAGGYWAQGPDSAAGKDPFVCAYAALLASVRTPSDDLGISWPTSHATYLSRVFAAMLTWNYTGASKPTGIAIALVYDLLYEHMDTDQRAFCVTQMTSLLDPASPFQWQSTGGHWNDQTSTQHVALTAMSIAMEDYEDRADKVIQEMQDWADAHATMQNGEGIGYAWKNAYTANIGPIFCAYMARNAYGLSDAASIERCLKSHRDAATQLRLLTQPHPGYTSPKLWMQARMHFQAPDATYHREANVGAFMLWGTWLCAGRVNVNPGAAYSHTPAANNESDLFAFWRHYSDQLPDGWSTDRQLYRACTNAKWVYTTSPANDKGHIHVLHAVPPWLIENEQLPAAKGPADAGIARVWRDWPGALNWVRVIGGTWESGEDQSLITYTHRRYWSNSYTAGTYINGMWQIWRGGPLFVKRGSASHGGWSKDSQAANGVVVFIDTDNYTEFEWNAGMDDDRGGHRNSPNNYPHYANMIADPLNDFGDFTGWYSDDDVVAITDDLTRSYNSTIVATNGAAKISSFIREVVIVQRGADGSDRERLFVYDRIAVLGSGRYRPQVCFALPMDPSIDGDETAYTPSFPDPPAVSINEPISTWKTTGPIRWDYDGASRLIIDGATFPNTQPYGGSGNATGKAVLTWLRPTSANAVVMKRGGLAQYWDPDQGGASRNNCPHFDAFGALRGIDGQWYSYNSSPWYPFVGLYSVYLWDSVFNADTRFLLGVDVMDTGDTPDTTEELTCDAGSIAARVGASAVCFKEATGTRTSGSVTIPSGVTLLVLANLAPSATRTLTPGGTLTITTAERDASTSGVLVVGLTGTGTLEFS